MFKYSLSCTVFQFQRRKVDNDIDPINSKVICENFSIISCFNLTQKIKNCFISLEAVVGDASLNLYRDVVI